MSVLGDSCYTQCWPLEVYLHEVQCWWRHPWKPLFKRFCLTDLRQSHADKQRVLIEDLTVTWCQITWNTSLLVNTCLVNTQHVTKPQGHRSCDNRTTYSVRASLDHLRILVGIKIHDNSLNSKQQWTLVNISYSR